MNYKIKSFLPLKLFAIFIPLFSNIAHAQTPISGTISSGSYTGDYVVTSGNTLTITTGTVSFSNDLYVEPNAHLIVQSGATLKIGTDVRYGLKIETDPTMVLSGATLFAQNSTITSLGSKWKGIEIWGISSYVSQGSSYMAKGTFDNVIISNAAYGVSNYMNADNEISSALPGGIIIANNTTFKNNYVSVAMRKYKRIISGVLLNDRSLFTKCNFVRDANVFNPYVFVKLDGVNGITLQGCSFDDQTTGYMYGIFGIDAGFSVRDHCSSHGLGHYGFPCAGTITHSSFNNLDLAVNSNCVPGPTFVGVEGATFNHCFDNIQLQGNISALVLGNTITTDGAKINNDHFYGIVMWDCPGFKVENNIVNISSYSGHTGGGNIYAIGIDVINAGQINNEVYGNAISNADYLLESIGNNRANPPLTTGLKFLCNSLNASQSATYDILSSTWGSRPKTATTGMNPYQNQSTVTGTAGAGNYFDLKTRLSGSNHIYIDASSNTVDYYYSSGNSRENPVYNNLGFGRVHLASEVPTCVGRSIYSINSTPYTVNNDAHARKMAIRSELASAAPDQQYIGKLLTDYESIVDSAIVTAVWGDTNGVHLDSLEALLDSASFLYDYKIMLARVYVAEGRHTDAINLLTSLNTNFDMTNEEKDRIDNLITIFNVEKQLSENNNDWDALSSAEKDAIRDIDNTDDYWAKGFAMSYRMKYDGVAIYDPEYAWANESLKNGTTEIGNFNSKGNLSVYPNPADDQVRIDNSANETDRMVISDVTGKIVLTSNLKLGSNIINVKMLNPGVYFVKFFNNKEQVYVAKFVKI